MTDTQIDKCMKNIPHFGSNKSHEKDTPCSNRNTLEVGVALPSWGFDNLTANSLLNNFLYRYTVLKVFYAKTRSNPQSIRLGLRRHYTANLVPATRPYRFLISNF